MKLAPLHHETARVLRKSLGLTQAQVAEHAGLSTGTYKRFERGCKTGRTSALAITLVFIFLTARSA